MDWDEFSLNKWVEIIHKELDFIHIGIEMEAMSGNTLRGPSINTFIELL
jgi:hypothetical protein